MLEGVWRLDMEAKVNGMEQQGKAPATSQQLAKMPSIPIAVKNIDLDMDEIKKWIAPQGATAKEIYTFGRICQSLGLSPFKKEIYFIKYGNMDASIVVGYQTYIDRGERSGQLDGWNVEMDDPKNPTQATITIHRKDWTHPFEWTVYREEVEKLKKDGSPQSTWATQPRFQLMKCAIAQGFRLAFPSECGELPYTAEEIDVNMNGYLPQVPEITEAEITGVSEPEPDIFQLHRDYFKKYRASGMKEEDRHDFQQRITGKASTKEWTVAMYHHANEVLDGYIDEDDVPIFDSKVDEDAPETPPTNSDGADSPDAIHGQIQAKINVIRDLLPTAFGADVYHPGFLTWCWGILGEDFKGTQLRDMPMMALDNIIDEMKARADKDADDAADEGMLL